MEINYMCMGDILQYLTKNLTISDKGVMNGIKTVDLLNDFVNFKSNRYSKDAIWYAIVKLAENDYILYDTSSKREIINIYDVTVKGHEYLANYEF